MRGNAVHAMFRFGLGPAPGELATIGSDPCGWLAGQLDPEQALPEALRGVGPSPERMVLQLQARNDKDKQAEARNIFRQDGIAHLSAAMQSSSPFVERLNRFWLNHFTISARRPTIRSIAVPFEVEAIRPNLLGRFADLLVAAIRHQAMLFYLDNAGSTGPNSPISRKQHRGLNENLGREVLELHSLGVEAGYTQDDVHAMALILTGWAVERLDGDRPGHFIFDERRHEPGEKTLLGQRFPEAGEEEGLAALEMLATHPATAHHIATKLTRHFVADNPPQTAVERLVKVFLETKGELVPLYRALIDLDEAWEMPLSKLRTPQELVIATGRGAGQSTADKTSLSHLYRLGHAPFMALSPAGWPDGAADWIGPEAMLNRVDWAYAAAGRIDDRVAPDDLLNVALGSFATADLKTAVAQAPSRREALAYVLASPAFQRR